MNYWKTNYNDRNSTAESTAAEPPNRRWQWQPPGLGNALAFPTSGSRLCPTAKLVFHVGIAFVKCERVNNTISRAPARAENNQQPGSCQPRGKNYQLCLKFYLWLLCLAPLFIRASVLPQEAGPQDHGRGGLRVHESRTGRWSGEWTGHAGSIISFPLKLRFPWGRGRQGARIYRSRF